MTDTTPDDRIEAVIRQLVTAAPEGRSIAPEDVARAADPDNWHKRFGHVRQAAIRLMQKGQVAILRKGKPVPLAEAKGVIRYAATPAP